MKKFSCIKQLKKRIMQYINYCTRRIKSNLKGMSPIQYRAHNYQN
ncbi:IS3 family transposase [Flavobacterium oreochromis]